MLKESWTFFKQWAKNPAQLGTFLPISEAFAATSAKLVKEALPQNYGRVLELGAGTGRLTNALANEGVEKITTLEIDKELNQFLQKRFENNKAVDFCLEGDACKLDQFFDPESVDFIVSVIPLMYLPLKIRLQIIESGFKVLKKGGRFFHVCYTPVSPIGQIPEFTTQKLYNKWGHFPPGFVWEFIDNKESEALYEKSA